MTGAGEKYRGHGSLGTAHQKEVVSMSTLPQKAPGSLSQAYQLLALVALSGELPASQLSRLAGGTSYKENVVKSLKRQRLLLSYYKNGLR